MSKPLDVYDQLRNLLIENGATPEDMDRFDTVVSRRRFFGRVGRGSAALALLGFGAGTEVALKGLFGRGMIPAAWAEEAAEIEGKPGMIVHNHRPVNGEFPPHLLDDTVTPTKHHFVRNNGLVPERAHNQDPQGWTLTIDGEVHNTLKLSLDELMQMPSVTHQALIECGGNGRANFEPPVRGNPWDRGAIACSEWTGVRLRDLLDRAGLKESAVYTAHYGADPPIGAAPPFSRGIPIDKAMEEHTLVAYRMNGEPLHALNGYPVRVVVPGWIGSASEKWLERIWIRDQVHDSKKMTGYSYRIPRYPVIPGTRPPEEDMKILTAWQIKSMITAPEAENPFSVDKTIGVRGHAWAGENQVDKVMISTDYGINWKAAKLMEPANKYAWYDFESEVSFDGKGYYEIWARAFDKQGNAQPFRQPWNPKGYLGNVIHRVPVLVDL
ncbi:MAG: sulfite oxidase [Gammaproteobacteria bacterium]|jgi:DMSO/TMAO reductase YedYZ molybdopterin-dependent catalytic subunit